MTPAARPVPAVAHPGTAAAIIAVATSQVGYREGPHNDTAYGDWYGLNGEPWCAMFAYWAAAHSLCSAFIPRFAYTPAGADWFREHGRWGHTPHVGAYGFVYSAAMGRIHHVFIVTAVLPGGTVATIEGNTSRTGSATGDGVYRLRRGGVGGTRGGYGYPAYLPGPVLPRVSLLAVRAAARIDPGAPQGHTTHRGDVIVVEHALHAEGLLDTRWVDGSFGTRTLAAYAAWQRRCGLHGADADGIPGVLSLGRLGHAHGFTVTP